MPRIDNSGKIPKSRLAIDPPSVGGIEIFILPELSNREFSYASLSSYLKLLDRLLNTGIVVEGSVDLGLANLSAIHPFVAFAAHL